MTKTFCLSRVLKFSILVVVVVKATRTGRIRITEGDPRDLTLYKGPSNEYTPGRNPLPSYILRAKPTEEQGDRGKQESFSKRRILLNLPFPTS